MKCRFCGEIVVGVLSKQDIHVKTREFICSSCGLIRNDIVIDGETVRSWVKK